jgi:hypothetical protein
MLGDYGRGTVRGEDRDIQELLAAIEVAFVGRSEDELTDNDGKLLGLLRQLVHDHPEGFFLMHGEKVAFSHHRVEYFQHTGRQEDIRRFQAELSDTEVERLGVIERRVANALFNAGN